MDVEAVFQRGQNLIIRENLHHLIFLHQCLRCGKYFRALDPKGNEIPTSQEERNFMAGQIDNVRYTDSHGICDECDKIIEQEEIEVNNADRFTRDSKKCRTGS